VKSRRQASQLRLDGFASTLPRGLGAPGSPQKESPPSASPRERERQRERRSDPAARDRIMADILAYNEEDLDATRAVMEWLRTRDAGAISDSAGSAGPPFVS
jgi:hypothetical protein